MDNNDMAVYRAKVAGAIRKRLEDPEDGFVREVETARAQAEAWRKALRFGWAEQVERALADFEDDPSPKNAETLMYVYRWCAKEEADEGLK